MNITRADLRLPAAHASMAACVATLLEHTPPGFDVSLDPVSAAREQLAAYGIGLAEVSGPAAFAWPGPFIARLAADADPVYVVMFGEPPAVIWDPLQRPGPAGVTVSSAYVLAPFELRAERLSAERDLHGRVEAILVAPAARAPMLELDEVEAVAGRGLRGDRHLDGRGTFSTPGGRGNALTLITAEALEATSELVRPPLTAHEARRNVVTRGIDLDQLIGRRFTVGTVACFGRERCEPCAHLQGLTRPGALRSLVHRGGLRADILEGGRLRRGDAIEVDAAPGT